MESLFVKVALLLTMSMVSSAVGSHLGRNIRSGGAMIGLGIAFIGGAIATLFLAHAGPAIGIPALLIWTFVSGLFLGPVLQMYREDLGAATVTGVFAGTGGVMALCGAIGLFSGVDFSGMGSYLMFALFGLIIVGVIGLFIRMSRTTNIIYSLFGMVIFAGYFVFDFFRLGHTENTWEKAIGLTMSLYLDFVNFALHALQFLAAMKHK